MTIDLTLDGTTECRGRNRWFQLHEPNLSVHEQYGEVWLRVYSKRPAETAPIIFHFNAPDDLKTLICGLAKALAQMTTIPEKEDSHG